MATEYSPSEIVTQLGQRQLAMYFNVAALAIFVFDYCVTFSSEVQHIWGRKWETTRFVFTMSRYVPFIGSAMTCYNALYSHKCGSFIFALDAIYNIGIVFAEGILILRTYAMWQRSRKVLFFLLGLAVVFIVAATVLATKLNFSLPADAGSPYVFYPSSCAFGKSRNGAFQYILLMIYEIILQGMNTWKRFRTYRDVQSSTLRTLYWGGIMYMFGIIVLSASNMAIMVAAPIAYIDLLDT
ncbi:hypothetical protein HYDPIDRAFT_42934 [Hydnomerulius pinastri MD-312]|uniref:DUF6533 domain-containing protein n=1 Tax=Hydnomerulius pinastri MD-312 TaxID=994086 RepID=A0A0C9WBQ0_9AGAM|nr:hypothetical protein HYDPIDRAFT_42934 [Hydnomerulius pinastri MD-312]